MKDKIEPVVLLLALLMVVFFGILIFCEFKFSMDGQIFQVFSGLLTGISGAFLMRIKPKSQVTDDPDSTTIVSSNTKKVSPPIPAAQLADAIKSVESPKVD